MVFGVRAVRQQKRLEVGIATTKDVLDFQDDLEVRSVTVDRRDAAVAKTVLELFREGESRDHVAEVLKVTQVSTVTAP